MNPTYTVHEQVSALVDGHLQGDELAGAIQTIGGSAELRATWQTYHLVGEVLRSGGHTSCSDPALFLSRLQGRLAAEPVAALPLHAAATDLSALSKSVRRPLEAANEAQFRWKMVAGLASVVAVAAIGWNWVAAPDSHAANAKLALEQAPPAAVVAAAAPVPQPAQVQAQVQAAAPLAETRVMVGNGNAQVMLRDPRLDQLLEAHQQAGGASQMPSGFLRNATFERPSR